MNKILIVLTIIIGLTNCQLVDVLNQDPMYELDLDGAITTPDMAELALNGVYYYLPSTGLEYTFTTLSGSFMSGAMLRGSFITSGNAIYFSERNLPVLSYGSFGSGEWERDYNIIKNVNYLLTAMEKISDSDFKEGRKEEMIGECHFLSALAYFRLLRQFGEYWDMESAYGVLIRDELPSVSNAEKARATVAQSYEEIYRHLDIALAQAPEYSTSTRASVQAAKALKAVVLFYKGEYSEAAKAADEAITAVNPLDESFLNVFANAETSKEVIFCRAFGADETSSMTYYSSQAFNSGLWGPTESYMNLIEGDPRKELVVTNKDILYKDNTYNVNVVSKMYPSGEAVPVIFLRTAELYLIKAEALARSNASIADAWAPIKDLRGRVGSSDLAEPATRDELMDEIFKEWWIEMAFENWHEWFAVQRFDRLLEMNQSLADQLEDEQAKGQSSVDNFMQKLEWRKIYNIPTTEISANPACEQNPGY
ncbi:RagB/SusD family nutrient uptake outer membrane protein [Butyricimonas hominis]|uniref:RagB/SusD family nutrient uptake outer membrane protein n=1 Tax=Butyricimonas hominis TaxID=2763032 RepID=UPI00351408B7